MSGFVDAGDPGAVEQVLRSAVAGIGMTGVLEQLQALPAIPLQPGRRGGLFREREPSVLKVDDRILRLYDNGAAELQHVVRGIVLATDAVSPAALPGILAAMVVRSITAPADVDQLSVVLTALRDALAAGS